MVLDYGYKVFQTFFSGKLMNKKNLKLFPAVRQHRISDFSRVTRTAGSFLCLTKFRTIVVIYCTLLTWSGCRGNIGCQPYWFLTWSGCRRELFAANPSGYIPHMIRMLWGAVCCQPFWLHPSHDPDVGGSCLSANPSGYIPNMIRMSGGAGCCQPFWLHS